MLPGPALFNQGGLLLKWEGMVPGSENIATLRIEDAAASGRGVLRVSGSSLLNLSGRISPHEAFLLYQKRPVAFCSSGGLQPDLFNQGGFWLKKEGMVPESENIATLRIEDAAASGRGVLRVSGSSLLNLSGRISPHEAFLLYQKKPVAFCSSGGLQPDLFNQGGFWLKKEGMVPESENIATLRIEDAAASSRGVLRVSGSSLLNLSGRISPHEAFLLYQKKPVAFCSSGGLQPDLFNQGGFWLKKEGMVPESENIATLRIEDAAASGRGVLRVSGSSLLNLSGRISPHEAFLLYQKKPVAFCSSGGLQPDLFNQGGFWLKKEGMVPESENIATLRIEDAAASSRGVLRVSGSSLLNLSGRISPHEAFLLYQKRQVEFSQTFSIRGGSGLNGRVWLLRGRT